ncbi:MAG: hypothetical protein IJ864_03535 [Alphaproteobacteria bacterium]|nr:hypothetical protein [Alphaproteobacteria bacterium]
MKNILKNLNLIPTAQDYKIWIISYLAINITFLYHSLNLLWGNHDVTFIKDKIFLSSGIFEGRFSQFIPQWLLTNGQILPIINNLIGFAFLTLALWLLAKYWKIPQSTLSYTLLIIFAATQPYTLSWLYFTFITISCLFWCGLVILGLYLSAYLNQSYHKLQLSIVAITCFYLALGGYPPVINTIFVCLCGKITISYLYQHQSYTSIWHQQKYTLLNIILAALLFKLTLWFLPPQKVYNLELITLAAIPAKLLTTLKIIFNQFFVTLPFMERGYKLVLFLMVCIAFITATTPPKSISQTISAIGLLFITVVASAVTTFIAVAPTEYVARIDFYGLGFVYTFSLALLMFCRVPIIKSLTLLIALILIFMNIINDYRAQKIWHQGFIAEFQILDDITERIENHPQFDSHNQYRFYQIGDISLRKKYYHDRYTKDEPFLLSLPYLAIWQGARLAEFYSPFNYIDHQTPLLPQDITPQVYNYINSIARPYPHPNCIFLNKDIILVIYNQDGLTEFRRKITKLPPFFK